MSVTNSYERPKSSNRTCRHFDVSRRRHGITRFQSARVGRQRHQRQGENENHSTSSPAHHQERRRVVENPGCVFAQEDQKIYVIASTFAFDRVGVQWYSLTSHHCPVFHSRRSAFPLWRYLTIKTPRLLARRVGECDTGGVWTRSLLYGKHTRRRCAGSTTCYFFSRKTVFKIRKTLIFILHFKKYKRRVYALEVDIS